MSSLTHEKIIDIIKKIIDIASLNCACAIDENYKNNITNETKKCPNNCCYTCMTTSILMRLYLLNEDDILNLESFPKNIKLPNIIKCSQQYNMEKECDRDSFFLGMTNSIGLLWDVHCLLKPPFAPHGVEIALNDEKTKWFRESAILDQGINILVFYDQGNGNIKIVTHNAFIFVKDEICYLIDSWWGNSFIDNKDYSKTKHFIRETMYRIFSLNIMQYYLDIVNQIKDLTDISKTCIFTTIFLGPGGKGDKYHNRYVKILNNNILDEKINEGFNYRSSMFGGSQKKYNKKYLKYKYKYMLLKN